MNVDEAIVRVLQGRATPEDERRVAVWRSRGEANDRHYRDVAALWDLAGADGEAPPAPPVDHILAGAVRPAPRRRGRAAALAMSAAAALVLFAAGVALRSSRDAPAAGAFHAVESALTPDRGGTVRFSDGTVARLAPAARLSIPGDGGARAVELRGRAFFAVAHDAARPFEVRTGAGTVRVLGTRFEVRADADAVEVIVVEGRVALITPGGTREVAEGQSGRIDRAGGSRVATAPDEALAGRWAGPFLAFQETPLADAASEVARLYGRPVAVSDRGLGAQTVTGVFQDRSFEDVVTVLCTAVGATCDVRADGARIGSMVDGGP